MVSFLYFKFFLIIIKFGDPKLNQEVKAKRVKKKSVVAQERERLKNEQSEYDFNFEEFELKKKDKSDASSFEKSNQLAKVFGKKKAESVSHIYIHL